MATAGREKGRALKHLREVRPRHFCTAPSTALPPPSHRPFTAPPPPMHLWCLQVRFALQNLEEYLNPIQAAEQERKLKADAQIAVCRWGTRSNQRDDMRR